MRTAAKDIRFPDAGFATIKPSSWVEMRGGHYTSFALSNMRYAPAGQTFRTLGGTRPGLVSLGDGTVETEAPWEWVGSLAIEWPDGASMTLSAGSRSIVFADATLVEKTASLDISGTCAPASHQCACLWRGRNVASEGAIVYFSEIGNTSNWDTNADPEATASPIALNCALAGRGPKALSVTALIPFRDQHMFIATQESFHVLYGDPQGGKLQLADDRIGIVSPDAWAFDGETVWFLSKDGLYRRAGYGERHERVSEELAPGYLRDVDTAANHVSMVYCPWERGVYLDITPVDSTKEGVHVFIDQATGYLWPDRYPALSMEPVAHATAFFTDGTHPRAAFKGRDGLWRVHVAEADTDSGTAFTSSILLGPMRVAGNDGESAFSAEIECSFASQGAAVTMNLAAADTPEALLPGANADQSVEHRSFSHAAPEHGAPRRHAVWRPRARGAWASLQVSSARPFSFDLLRLTAKSTGRLRYAN